MSLAQIRQRTPPPQLPRHTDTDFERLLTFAPTISPEKVVPANARGEAARIYAIEQAAYINSLLYHTEAGHVPDSVEQRLANWLLCTKMLMQYTINRLGVQNIDSVRSIGSHEGTALAMAALLSHPEGISEFMTVRGADKHYTLVEDGTHIMATHAAKTINGIGDYSHTVLNGEIDPSDTFKTFAPWATEVAIRAIALNYRSKTKIVLGEKFGQTTFANETDETQVSEEEAQSA